MEKAKLLFWHFLVTGMILALLMAAFFAFFPTLLDVLENPNYYFDTNLSGHEMELRIYSFFIIITGVLVSYILYLLLTGRTRIELAAEIKTRWLAVSREQFRRLYDEAPIPYLMLDKEGQIKDPNKAALRFFETTPDNLINKNLFSFGTKESAQIIDTIAEEYKLKVPINRQEFEIQIKEGGKRIVLISIFEMKNPENNETVGLASIFDITEQKELDRAKSEFVSLASHQLRTPLATVKWYTDMLLSGGIGELSEKQKDYIGRMYSVNNGMIELVNTLLNVSRIEMGSLEVKKTATDAQKITDDILSELSIQIKDKNIQIERTYNDLLRSISTDPKLLRIVIHNLLTNAIKYSQDGGVIGIRFEVESGASRISVSDNGVGIPNSDKDKIFQKSFRGRNVQDMDNSQSSGLGLYLTKSVIDTLEGTISFTSEEGKGSVFTIEL